MKAVTVQSSRQHESGLLSNFELPCEARSRALAAPSGNLKKTGQLACGSMTSLGTSNEGRNRAGCRNARLWLPSAWSRRIGGQGNPVFSAGAATWL